MVIIDIAATLKITLIDGIGIDVQLVGVPIPKAIGVIEVMITDGSDKCDRRTALRIEHVAVLEEPFYAPGVEVYQVRVGKGKMLMRILSAAPTVIESAHKSLEGIVVVVVEPSVRHIHVLHFRHVGEGIVVAVHRHITAAVMGQDTRVERLMVAGLAIRVLVFFEGYLPAAHDIRFAHHFAVEHQVDRQRVLYLWLEQFDVDLTGGRFVAVDDGGGTFADLDTAHPRTWDILQPKTLRQSAYCRRVLLDELHVCAAQAQQPDLLGAGRRIGIGYIDRGAGLERFTEVTARRAAELFGVDLLRVEGLRTALHLAFLALHDGDFLYLEITRLLRVHACA